MRQRFLFVKMILPVSYFEVAPLALLVDYEVPFREGIHIKKHATSLVRKE